VSGGTGSIESRSWPRSSGRERSAESRSRPDRPTRTARRPGDAPASLTCSGSPHAGQRNRSGVVT
jgi:hypothetical protein